MFLVASLCWVTIAPEVSSASDAGGDDAGGAAAEMARKLQDPLASIAAVMTDNDILFKTGDSEATCGTSTTVSA